MMSRWGRITRRTLVLGSVAVAGGVAFGIWQTRRPVENPLVPEQGVTLNPYVIIDRQGTTIIVPRAEMGQGVHTTLAALVAEELDIAFDSIRVIHGPAADAYYNAALLRAGVPFAEYAQSGWQQTVSGAVGRAGRVLALQITAGSTSVIDAYERMRLAGAGARETLKMAAADRLGVPRAALETEDGAVIAPDGTRLSYRELAQEAADFPVPEPNLRDPSEWRYLGRSLPRTDMRDKVTGAAVFACDVRLPGMRFAAVRRNPHLGGGMHSLDAAPAEEMPGVERVIELEDGIAVVADTTWTAMRAAGAARIAWGPSSHPPDTAALFDVIEEAFDTPYNARLRDDGDAPAALAAAEGPVIEAEYQVPFLAHATMEPMNATAHHTGDALEIWTGNQAPILHRDAAAAAAGLDADAVTIHTTFMGGGFGRRIETDFTAIAAQVARAVEGTPVQVAWSREEDMRHGYFRPGARARMRGAVAQGRAQVLEAQVAAPSVTRQAGQRFLGLSAPGPDRGHLEGLFDQPYAIANYAVTGFLAELALPVGFWRSVGASFNGFFHESFIDELAHAAGRDPLAFRLDHIRDEHAASARTLEVVRDMAGWTGQTPEGMGRGVAFSFGFGTPVAEIVEVGLEGDAVRIRNAWIACDVGRALDPGIIRAQMESGLIFGLSAAVHGEITFAEGAVKQRNFTDYEILRMSRTPRIEVEILEQRAHPGGVGEAATPAAAPALVNALFDLTGERYRTLPLSRHLRFA